MTSSGQRKFLVLLWLAGVSSLERPPLQSQWGTSETTLNPSVAQSDSCWKWKLVWIQQHLRQASALSWRTSTSVCVCVCAYACVCACVCGYILRFLVLVMLEGGWNPTETARHLSGAVLLIKPSRGIGGGVTGVAGGHRAEQECCLYLTEVG